MNRFLQSVDTALRERCSAGDAGTLLVAVSGGLDSMVLMHALVSLSRLRGFAVTIAHFNHQLRGQDSDGDERFVVEAAKERGVPVVVGAGNVSRHAREQGISIEMAARHLRHEFLARTGRDRAVDAVVLGHHADDQVELFFVRLLRGAAPEGLSGMKWRNPSPADPAIRLIRPLLGHSRDELASYAKSHRIAFRQDATNDSLDHLRNRVRHDLLPLLQKDYQPAVHRVILRTMALLGDEADVVAQVGQRSRSRGVADFDRIPAAVQRWMLREEILRCGVEPKFEWIEGLRSSRGTVIRVRPDLQLSRDSAGKVRAASPEANPLRSAILPETKFAFRGQSGRIEYGGYVIDWQIRTGTRPRLGTNTSGVEWFDADRVGAQICLRGWQTGDRFQPLGMDYPSKLQNLFTNAKVSREDRRRLLVATLPAGGIWWVDRLRIGEQYKVRADSRRFLRWKWTVK